MVKTDEHSNETVDSSETPRTIGGGSTRHQINTGHQTYQKNTAMIHQIIKGCQTNMEKRVLSNQIMKRHQTHQ